MRFRSGARGALAAALVATLCVAGCVHGSRGAPQFRVGMVTDTGGLGDHSYNDAAYAGLRAARADLGIRAVLLQSRAPIDYAANLSLVASNAYDETIAVGYGLEMDLAAVAARFPNRRFAIVDGSVDAPNVTSVTFEEEQASFLAGALAALVSRTRTVAFLGGEDVPELRKFEAGFRAGARHVDPAVAVLVKYIGSYDDVAAGKELSGVLYAGKADIIFAAAGKAGLGAIDASRTRNGTYVIGVDSDQDGLLPGKILTSVLKRIDTSIEHICAQAKDGTLRSGHVSLGLKERAVGLTDFRYSRAIVTPAVVMRLSALRAAIVDGAIVVPSTREALFAKPRRRLAAKPQTR